MKDYSQGKIYTLRSHQTDKIYVGSTVQTLAKRFGGHKKDLKKHNTGKYHYVTSFEILQYPDCYIELMELWPCNSKMELEKREGEYIRTIDCVNKIIVGRTRAEYRQANHSKILEQKAEYRAKNRDKIQKRTECPHCQSVVWRSGLPRHQRTFKCKSKRECLIVDLSDQI